MREPKQQPFFQDLFKHVAALLELWGVRVYSIEAGNLSVVCAVILKEFVVGTGHGRIDIFTNHGALLWESSTASSTIHQDIKLCGARVSIHFYRLGCSAHYTL